MTQPATRITVSCSGHRTRRVRRTLPVETAHLVNAASLALGQRLVCANGAQVRQMLRFIDWWDEFR